MIFGKTLAQLMLNEYLAGNFKGFSGDTWDFSY